MRQHRFIVIGFALISLTALAAPQKGNEMLEKRLIDRGDGSAPAWMTLKDAFRFSKEAHQEGRCAGFMDVTGQKPFEAPVSPMVESFRLRLEGRPLTQKGYLEGALPLLDSARVQETVKGLSSNRNRYYRSQYGVESAKWIANRFKELSANRSDVKVELFSHSFEQPSVIATIPGQGPHQNEVVVIGGHEDSINQSAWGSRDMVAPGADDNATGVATVLEVFRVMIQTNFKPDRTLMFMTYAGEEVGLLGSQDIANRFRNQKKAVVAVMQLDMTGFPGAGDQVVFMTDFVSPELTRFTQGLMDAYVKVRWSTDQCGYACSDHASWTKAGFPSVMPFEATMSTDNKDIHTTRDLLSKLDFNHGQAFVRLGLSFMAELSVDSSGI
ncbi:MAG: M20/M25/M40 family metallo-hydrolase [Proteobacteria bacterium]|nr:M20/M25/M40 family metallo-hydrolase [Pseudomonadota bacterium]